MATTYQVTLQTLTENAIQKGPKKVDVPLHDEEAECNTYLRPYIGPTEYHKFLPPPQRHDGGKKRRPGPFGVTTSKHSHLAQRQSSSARPDPAGRGCEPCSRPSIVIRKSANDMHHS